MRDDSSGTVIPGGQPAPPGARGARTATAAESVLGAGRLGVLLAALAAALVTYAALAADVVHVGSASQLDTDIAVWIAESMPVWAEWLARPFTWLGGLIGVAIVVATVVSVLLRRGDRPAAVMLLAVAVGSQVLVLTAKAGYERPRPEVGSAIDLPSSFSFPSGHATTGVAVFGLLGLLAVAFSRTRRHRIAAAGAGFALGALIGASRVVLNVHYVTDVLAGACLGLAWLLTCLLTVGLIRR
jgi:membrane-associated phospholipid phosphatase